MQNNGQIDKALDLQKMARIRPRRPSGLWRKCVSNALKHKRTKYGSRKKKYPGETAELGDLKREMQRRSRYAQKCCCPDVRDMLLRKFRIARRSYKKRTSKARRVSRKQFADTSMNEVSRDYL